MQDNQIAIVEDTITGNNINEIGYFWHGHPDAAWWIEDNWARLNLDNKTLWIHSPQVDLEENQLQRLRGSRGQLTLAAKVLLPRDTMMIRWFFGFGETRPLL